ncbi:efflux RND transporter permease subunit [Sinomicrobium weinanense]|uniref:Multidrug efflux RND transporter permease subunit n=1 Tax=Sinomicrobium weinanense TaxID=2842200 RepID=A0A926JSA2_9FLAO|nr:multidrug efflux RND transporter permease subunit [Sinomicrobium weinanense]MBC9796592.1 multidrug efflux RND transporter permease subunit [Sinomicrobium weinanense]MBU3123576.1 multidrug efflux RND transporter permease subunit [Sinomicrobium weinanense]
MKFSHTFIKRPILSIVISIILMIIGGLAYFTLPISQYPDVAPPTVVIRATYPGASAETISKTVATPLEQEINGVEGMIYMFSQATNDGALEVTVSFEQGVDVDNAQVLVQNRVAIAEPRLPEQVRRLGVTTEKSSPDLMMVVHMISPDNTYDQTYLANYANFQIIDRLSRIDGIGAVRMFGGDEYSMRIWLNPDLIATMDMTPNEILAALRSQNIQIAGGTLNQQPLTTQNAFEINVQTQGRLQTIEEFENIIVRNGEQGELVRVKDIGRVELGAASYATKGYLSEYPAVALPIFQRPGTNALETADAIKATMKEAAKDFPKGIEYRIAYNPTEFIQQSIDEVGHTIYEAVFLVVLVIILFLQTWRAAIIPILAIPVSLIGTFAVMQGLGYSLNYLTLFGLVLAIGIVVDDAIVVVENMERNLREGMSVKKAARKTMNEVGGALIAMGLVLVAVFLPTAFLEGISGQFYSQFGVTIAVATVISVFVSLSLSPAIAAIVMKKHKEEEHKPSATTAKLGFVPKFFAGFNRLMDWLSLRYGQLTSKFIHARRWVLVVYAGLILLTVFAFYSVPTGFIPAQDQGYFISVIQLPPGSSLERTDKVVKRAIDSVLTIDGISDAVAFTGFDAASFTNSSNAGVIFPVLEDFQTRKSKGISYANIQAQLNSKLGVFKDAFVVNITPPPVRGIGNAGGFKLMLQDKSDLGSQQLLQSGYELMAAANADPVLSDVFTFFNTSSPQLFFDLDKERAQKLGIPIEEISSAIEVYLGSAFVNDFNLLGKTFRVTAQADGDYRYGPEDLTRIRVKNKNNDMIPLGAIGELKDISGPSRVPRYNLYPALGLTGNASPGYSSGEALEAMERLAEQTLPDGIDYEWTDIAYQQKKSGNTAGIAFALAVLFVFLLLAAQYESWVLPLAVILIVPMCLLSAMLGVGIAGMDNNILTQIGLVVLVGLASKNAILIVEFAKQLEDQGYALEEAAKEAARLRLRPILMTAFAFILGVVPLVLASGAGAEMRRSLGTAVFSGMLGVTFFGLLFTPVFYVLCRKIAVKKTKTIDVKA